MKPKNPPTLSQHLCFKLYSTSLKMTQLYKSLLVPLNLTYPQYLVMVVLWEEEGIGMKDLAERLHLDAGSVTPLVKRLEINGYVIRSKNPHDERNRILTLTKNGKALRVSGIEVSQQIASFCGISLPKADILMRSLDTLNHNIGEVLIDA